MFHDAGDAVQAPVHQDAELEVLPLVQLLEDGRVVRPDVTV